MRLITYTPFTVLIDEVPICDICERHVDSWIYGEAHPRHPECQKIAVERHVDELFKKIRKDLGLDET
jgi:hypothetical protein